MFVIMAIFCAIAANVLIAFHPQGAPRLANYHGVRYIGSR